MGKRQRHKCKAFFFFFKSLSNCVSVTRFQGGRFKKKKKKIPEIVFPKPDFMKSCFRNPIS
jgi:hypothetical protein